MGHRRRWPPGSAGTCAGGGGSPAPKATPSRYPRRRGTCASSATSSSTSPCLACWRPSPSASCSATRATSSCWPTEVRVSARHHRPRSIPSEPATTSMAHRCIRSACASTTSRPATCRPAKRRHSRRISITRPARTSVPERGGPIGLRSITHCGSAATASTSRATATRRPSPSRSRVGRSEPRRSSSSPTTTRRCCPPEPFASTHPPGYTRRISGESTNSPSQACSRRPSRWTANCCLPVSRR